MTVQREMEGGREGGRRREKEKGKRERGKEGGQTSSDLQKNRLVKQ